MNQIEQTKMKHFILRLLLSCFCLHDSLFSEEMSSEHPQVICTYSKIKDGCLENVKEWLKSLENERKDEVLESFRNEGVLLECAFVRKENDAFYLVYMMRAHDVAMAMDIFRNSTLPGDAFHKQCWQQFTEQHEVLKPVLHVESETLTR